MAKLGQTIDRIKGLQDYKIYRMDCLKLNRALTMDRIAGLQDLKDRVLGLAGRKQ